MFRSRALSSMTLCSLAAVACGAPDASTPATSRQALEPEWFDGRPTCDSLGLGWQALTVAPVTGITRDSSGWLEVSVEQIDGVFDWRSNRGIDAVIASSSDESHVFRFQQEATSGDGLAAPGDATETTFCFDFEAARLSVRTGEVHGVGDPNSVELFVEVQRGNVLTPPRIGPPPCDGNGIYWAVGLPLIKPVFQTFVATAGELASLTLPHVFQVDDGALDGTLAIELRSGEHTGPLVAALDAPLTVVEHEPGSYVYGSVDYDFSSIALTSGATYSLVFSETDPAWYVEYGESWYPGGSFFVSRRGVPADSATDLCFDIEFWTRAPRTDAAWVPASGPTVATLSFDEANGASSAITSDGCGAGFGDSCTSSVTSIAAGHVGVTAVATTVIDGASLTVGSEQLWTRWVDASLSLAGEGVVPVSATTTVTVAATVDDGEGHPTPVADGTQIDITTSVAVSGLVNGCALGTVDGVCIVTFTRTTAGPVVLTAALATQVFGVSLTRTANVTTTFESPAPIAGCGPGFWKNHPKSWPAAAGFTPQTRFNAYFGLTAAQSGLSSNTTMLQALGANGGTTGKLARHGVAALLNAAAGLNTGYGYSALFTAIQRAFSSRTYEPLAGNLATANEAGCPLN